MSTTKLTGMENIMPAFWLLEDLLTGNYKLRLIKKSPFYIQYPTSLKQEDPDTYQIVGSRSVSK